MSCWRGIRLMVSQNLRSDSSQIVQAISADLTTATTSQQALVDAVAHSKFSGKAPDHVYLCAGFAKPGFFVTTSEKDLQQGLDGVYWVSAWTAQVRQQHAQADATLAVH